MSQNNRIIPPADPPAYEPAPPQEANYPLPKWLPPTAFVVGVVAMGVILALVVSIPNPTLAQFNIFRTIIALAGAAFAMAISGFIIVRIPIGAKGFIVAGGALAVFVILYFFSPAGLLIKEPQSNYTIAEQRVEKLRNEVTAVVARWQSIGPWGAAAGAIAASDVRRTAGHLGDDLILVPDSQIRTAYQVEKYQNAAYAYMMAAEVESDASKARAYAAAAVQACDHTLALINGVRANGVRGQYEAQIADWVRDQECADFANWIKKISLAIEANNGQTVSEDLLAMVDGEISSEFKARYPFEKETSWSLYLQRHKNMEGH